MFLLDVSLMLLAFAAIATFVRAEQRLSALFSAMDEVVMVIDGDGRYVEAAPNPQLLLPSTQYRGRKLHEVLPAATADVVLANVRRAIAHRQKCTVDYALPAKGQTTWWSAVVTPLGSDRALWVARDITDRKRAEEALQESNAELEAELLRSEKLHRGLVEQARDVIFTLDREGRFTSLNPAFESIVGWRAEEWLGRHFRDLLDARVREAGDHAFASALAGDSVLLSRAFVRGRGRNVTFEVSLVTQRAHGEVSGLLGLARDVTAREREQEQLRRSEHQLRDSQRIARLGSWEHDLVHDRVWFSEELYRLLGVPRREGAMTREEARAFLSPAQRNHYVRAVEKLQTQDEYESEVCHRDGRGEESIFACRARIDRDAEGRALRILGSVQDITGRRRGEQRIRESEERFRLMSRATNDVVWDWNLETGEMRVGDNMHTVYGYDPAACDRIEKWLERVHPEDLARVNESIAAVLESSEPGWNGEYRVRRADGTYAEVLDRAYVVRDGEGRPLRLVGAIMDVTERRQMQEQLAQANHLSGLGRVAAQIAHEFNNVLMGMQANVQLLHRRAPVQLAKPVDHVLRAVQRGKRITEEILSFTRRSAPSLEAVPLESFVASWQQEIRPLLGQSIDLAVAVEPGLHMLADPLQIAQVLTNLALNARDAMDGRGFLDVKVERSRSTFGFFTPHAAGEYVHIRVEDSGAGMTAEQLEHVFEPLFTTKHGGTGLGLAVTYQIITRHNGFITAESEPGSGATFHVLLPVTEAPADTEEEHVQKPIRQATRILIVEDERAVAAGLQALLELDDIDSTVVYTGGAAVEAIERDQPDAVILDIGLPDISGTEVYRQIAARWPEMPVLFSSGHANPAELDAALRQPHIGLLRKPYDYEALRAALAKLSVGGIADLESHHTASLPVM